MLLLLKELITLIINKVEICGVNTSKLPVLKEKKKETFIKDERMEITRQEKHLLKEI